MRAYRVTINGPETTIVRFCPTQADASGTRRKFAEELGVQPLADTTVEEVDVPTDKVGLIAYLNSLYE